MAQRLALHIGLMKSGTTFLQGRLDTNRDRLAEQGVLFPGPSWGRQVRAVSDLIESAYRKPGAWASLRDEINAHPGTAVVSMEYLAPIGAPRIATLRDAFPGTELDVVISVRDLGRSVPAMWQEAIKNRQTWPWPEYVESIRTGGKAGKRFWRQQHSSRIAARWASKVGAEHVHVLTIPPPGAAPEVLWDRFCQITGIGPDTWQEAPRSNESLGAASTLMMRLLNEQTHELTLPEYKKRVKALAKHQLGKRKAQEDPIGFQVPRWLRAESKRIQDQLVDSGVHIVGSVAELDPVDVPGVDPTTVSLEAQRDAAVSALATVLRQVQRVT
ncbi:conserved hypothetical protein [metagenome]|uniref:Sulfotransferase family protein n=1 Tax=metagenome TaxID=256318 RepID=A0A2P2CGA7_9ZZZZ